MWDYYNGILNTPAYEDLDKHIFELALSNWTERPQLGHGYNKQSLKIYDALIWSRVESAKNEYKMLSNMIRSRKKQESENQENKNPWFKSMRSSTDLQVELDELLESVNTWKYIGKLYRVVECNFEKLDFHGLIASWTNDPMAFDEFNHLYQGVKYTFLVADTGKNWYDAK